MSKMSNSIKKRRKNRSLQKKKKKDKLNSLVF